MKTRCFYHTDEEKIYTLSELEKLYKKLVASGDINMTVFISTQIKKLKE